MLHPTACGYSQHPTTSVPSHGAHPSLLHPAVAWLHPSLTRTICRRETTAVFLAAVFATDYTREYCNFHQIPGQIYADIGRVLYKPTCISQTCDRSTMGKAIKHGFWGCFHVNGLPMPERLQGTENRRYLCKSQLLSLGHYASFTKLLELFNTGTRACLHYTFPFSPSHLFSDPPSIF